MFYSFYCLGFWAILLIFVGLLLLLTNLGIISAAVWAFWPLLLIIIGIYFLTLRRRRRKIAVHQIFQKLATDERVHDKINKIIGTINEVVEKKIDEWHDEVTTKKKEDTHDQHEHFSGKPKIRL
jgi:preprotein translocase subunit YajC